MKKLKYKPEISLKGNLLWNCSAVKIKVAWQVFLKTTRFLYLNQYYLPVYVTYLTSFKNGQMFLINNIAVFLYKPSDFIFHIISKVVNNESCLGQPWLAEMLFLQVLFVEFLDPWAVSSFWHLGWWWYKTRIIYWCKKTIQKSSLAFANMFVKKFLCSGYLNAFFLAPGVINPWHLLDSTDCLSAAGVIGFCSWVEMLRSYLQRTSLYPRGVNAVAILLTKAT